MFKNVASQSIELFAFDTTTGAPKTGDATNMVFYVTKDFGSVVAIASNSGVPTEVDSTNAKGVYKIALSQAETNADHLGFSGKSSTSNVSVVVKGIDTYPANFSTLFVDSSGRVDVIKVNGTSQTAGDIYSKVSGLTFTGAGKVDASVRDWIGGTIPAVNVTGVPLVDLKYTLGTISPATAGSVRADAVTGAVGSVTGLTASDVGAIKTKTDSLAFTVAGQVDGNMLSLNGDATSAANLAKTTKVIGRGTVSGSPSTTSIPTSAMLPAGVVADQFKGRIITFDAATTTTALRGQATDITASSNSATPTFTVTALTTAPASGDTFSIT